MAAFLINGDCIFTYDELLSFINNNRSYYPLYKTHELYAFFSNLVKALANGYPLVLLDSDINMSEIDGIDKSSVNTPVCKPFRKFRSINEMIDTLLQSESEITIFTSGTTGQPKKVIHTISTLTRSTRKGDKYQGKVWAFAYNPTHMAGLQVFFQAFANQNTLVNVFNLTRSEVYNQIATHKITHLSATPTFYRLLLPFEKEYPFLQRVTLGGEKSDNHLYESIHKIFPNAKINNVYASTEAGSLLAAKGNCFQLPKRNQDVLQIVNDELLIHRSLLGQSNDIKFDGDYYHTGDLIEWVNKEEGIFKFKSRLNELINTGGYKVNPNEVENRLNAIDGVRQSLVYGKANSVLGNVLCADIQLEDNCTLTELDIRHQLKDQLQDFKIPRKIKFVESFDLTRTGKLKRI